MANVYHFRDLSPETQEALLRYIKSRFTVRKTINQHVSAYGLKQGFNVRAQSPEHVTSQCFAEAMEFCGFQSKLIGDVITPNSNWRFNVYVLKKPRDLK